MEPATSPLTVSMRIPVAWGDMDALGHVNNTVFLRWFESVRIGWWERLGLSTNALQVLQDGIAPILARTTIDYRRPVKYPDTIEISVTTQRVGGKSVVLGYRVNSSAQGGALVAEGETVIVIYDYRRSEVLTIPPELRRQMGAPPSEPPTS